MNVIIPVSVYFYAFAFYTFISIIVRTWIDAIHSAKMENKYRVYFLSVTKCEIY